jgi:hypothetical protein
MTSINQFKPLAITLELLDSIEFGMADNIFEVEWYLDLQEENATFISSLCDDPDDEYIMELMQEIEKDPEDKRFIPIPRGHPMKSGA